MSALNKNKKMSQLMNKVHNILPPPPPPMKMQITFQIVDYYSFVDPPPFWTFATIRVGSHSDYNASLSSNWT